MARPIDRMRVVAGWYGANPLHLLALLACFALAGYAAVRLLPAAPVGIVVWWFGAVIGHDLVLFPLYAVADRSVQAVLRHRPVALPPVPWVNYVRIPAALSGLLLLVWFPLILRLPANYEATTGFTTQPYLPRWLLVTAALFAASAIAFALRLRRHHGE